MLAQLYAEDRICPPLYLHGLKTRAKLYAYWETYLITYTGTHAFILNHNKHITVPDIGIFMNSYNRFTYIIILVTNLCLFRSLVYGTELILIAILYLLRTYTYDRLIFIPISRRTHLYLSPVGHILILVSRRTHTYIDFLICDIEPLHILRLISRRTHTYAYLSSDIYLCLSLEGHILIQISQRTYIRLILILVLRILYL